MLLHRSKRFAQETAGVVAENAQDVMARSCRGRAGRSWNYESRRRPAGR